MTIDKDLVKKIHDILTIKYKQVVEGNLHLDDYLVLKESLLNQAYRQTKNRAKRRRRG